MPLPTIIGISCLLTGFLGLAYADLRKIDPVDQDIITKIGAGLMVFGLILTILGWIEKN